MSVCRIQHHGIYALGIQGRHAVQRIRGNADAGRYPQTSVGVLAGIRMQALLDKVFIGNKAHDAAVGIYHGQFFHFVILQDLLYIFAVRAGIGDGYQVPGSHHVPYQRIHVREETDIPVGYDTYQVIVVVRYGDAADVILFHQVQGVSHGLILVDGNRVYDHAVLRALHLPHLGRLLGDTHIFMNYADTSFPCQGDGHRRFCYGVHSGGHNGDVQVDVAGKLGLQAHFPRKDFRIGRNQEDIIKC